VHMDELDPLDVADHRNSGHRSLTGCKPRTRERRPVRARIRPDGRGPRAPLA
jgi:hypothetical protein